VSKKREGTHAEVGREVLEAEVERERDLARRRRVGRDPQRDGRRDDAAVEHAVEIDEGLDCERERGKVSRAQRVREGLLEGGRLRTHRSSACGRSRNAEMQASTRG